MTNTAIDLFSGAGGFSHGLQQAGFDILFGADNWHPAIKTYQRNFSHPILDVDLALHSADSLRELAALDNRQVDLVVGGPPCQGFSIQRIGPHHDYRNNLILEFGRLVSDLSPRFFVMENVPGLLGRRGIALAEAFEDRMRKSGYHVEAVLVNMCEYDIPQVRRRVLYYGWRRGERRIGVPPVRDEGRECRTVWDTIGDLPSPPLDFTPHPTDPLHRRTRLSALNEQRLQHIPPGGGMEDLPVELRVDCHKNGADRIGHRYVYGRLDPSRPAATITARFDSFTRGKFGHPYEHRSITLREGARLQTFPDSFVFVGTQEEIAALIGNAVPPLFARYLGNVFAEHLAGKDIGICRKADRSSQRQLSIFDPVEDG